MNIILILKTFCLISAVLTYGLGIFVYAKNTKSQVNRLFLLVMVTGSYWAVGEFLIWNINSYDNVWFWLKASSLWTIVISLCVHFILTFAGHPLSKPDKIWILGTILYVPSIFFSLVNIFSTYIFDVGYNPYSAYYYYTPVFNNPVYIIATIYFVAIMIWGIVVGFHACVKSGKDKFRRQSSSLSIGILVVIGFGSQSVAILPMFNIYTPNLVFIGIVFYSCTIAYAILKYGLFVLSPETVATNIIRMIPDGLILTDMDDQVVTANQSAQKIFPAEWKKDHGKLTVPPFPEPVYQDIKKTILEMETISDYEVIQDNSEQKNMSISGSLVKDPYENPAGIILIIRDITARKKSEKALRMANEKISLLTRLTRHDISNMVTALSGYLELLKEHIHEDDPEELLMKAMNQIDRIRNQLIFSQQYQEIGLHAPLWQSLETIIDLAIRDITSDSVEISVSIPQVWVYTDPLSVKVIFNLLDNAIRHGNCVSWIRITSIEEKDHALILIIEDNGNGIPEEDKERIFAQGFGKNTGLGLTLCREILQVTGITIIEKGIPGNGARFEIHVPPDAWKKSNNVKL